MKLEDKLRAAYVLDKLYGHSSIFSILPLPFSRANPADLVPEMCLDILESKLYREATMKDYKEFCNRLLALIDRWISKPIPSEASSLSKAKFEKCLTHQISLKEFAQALCESEFVHDVDELTIFELQKHYTNFAWPEKGARWFLKIQATRFPTLSPRDSILYEGLHAPLVQSALKLCPEINTTTIIPQQFARLAFRVYIAKNRRSLTDCVNDPTGLIYTLLTYPGGQFIVVLRPISEMHEFEEFDLEGDVDSPKSWVWALMIGVSRLSGTENLKMSHRSTLHTPKFEIPNKPLKKAHEQTTAFLDYLLVHFRIASDQSSSQGISRFSHDPLFPGGREPDQYSPPPQITAHPILANLILPSGCIAFSNSIVLDSRLSTPDIESSLDDSLYNTPLDQEISTPAQELMAPTQESKVVPVKIKVKEKRRSLPPIYYSEPDKLMGLEATRLDRCSWFTAKANIIIPYLGNQIKTPEYPVREFLRPDELVPISPTIATAASVPRQRIFSDFVIMRALINGINELPTEQMDDLKADMGKPLTDGHFKVIFAHPDHKETRVVSLFKIIEPDNLPARLNELALLMKFKGIKGFSQILSTVTDKHRQLVGFTLRRHAATFKELLHRGSLPSHIKLGLVYRLANVLQGLHQNMVSHRDLSEVNLMVDSSLVEMIKSSRSTFNRPRKSRKTSDYEKVGVQEISIDKPIEDLISEDPIIIDFGKSAFLSSNYTNHFKQITGALPPYVSAPEHLPNLRLDTPDEGFRLYRSIVTLPGSRNSNVVFDGLKEDVYGFGIIVFRVITGVMPWGSLQESCLPRLREIVSSESEQNRYLNHDLPNAPHWRKLLLKTLHPDPNLRWPMSKVVAYLRAFPNALLNEL